MAVEPARAAADTPLEIVEPTLEDATGHCFSFLESFCRAAGDRPLRVWAARRAAVSFPGQVTLEQVFDRRLRRWQAWRLYRRLLREPGRIFVPTAGRTDLALLDFAAQGEIPAGKVVAYVHWYREAPGKRRHLARLAARQPGIAILAPTESIRAEYAAAGFPRTRVVPYPVAPAESGEAAAAFRHVLYAGAARSDKGFPEVVAGVARAAALGERIPFRVQTSPQHYEKVDAPTAAAIAQLEALDYPALVREPGTLPAMDYDALFSGAICVQLYSREDFADRVSGVTLDALRHGSPVVARSRTWMARLVEEFGAGEVLEEASPDALLGAVRTIAARYADYSARAARAGRELARRHDAKQLYRAVTA